jgi:cytochrome c oxidase subunit 2
MVNGRRSILAWTAGTLFGFALYASAQTQDVPSGRMEPSVRVISMTGKRYAFDPCRIVVISGEKIRIEIRSLDVPHGFALTGYGIDQSFDLEKPKTIEFTAKTPGRVPFHCSVYCGSGHTQMQGEMIVLPK